MKNRSQILVFMTLFITIVHVYAQKTHNKDIKFSTIELIVKHSMKIYDNPIYIQISNTIKGVKVIVKSKDLQSDKVPWRDVKSNSEFIISTSEHDKIIKSINALDFNEFFKPSKDLMISTDGYTCELSYGDNMHSISLKTKTPTSNTKERQLQDYLSICNLILNKAKMGNLETLFIK